MARFVITGGLGTGKTTLISALSDSISTVAEPARELIAEHRLATDESTLDKRPEEFVQRLIERSIHKYAAVSDGVVAVFDRGLPDCVAYAKVYGLDVGEALAAAAQYRYETPVFVAAPWAEIYRPDDMRRATFAQAQSFYAEVVAAYESLDYEMVQVPQVSPVERAAFIEGQIL